MPCLCHSNFSIDPGVAAARSNSYAGRDELELSCCSRIDCAMHFSDCCAVRAWCECPCTSEQPHCEPAVRCVPTESDSKQCTFICPCKVQMAGSITQKHTRVMQGQVSAAPHIHQRASSSSSLNSACMKRTSFEGEREVMRARSAFYAWPRWYSTLCGSDSEWHAGWLAVAAHPTELGWDSSSICLTMHLRIWTCWATSCHTPADGRVQQV